MTEQSILQGINDNPGDNVRHNIYADWLDEQGRKDDAEKQRRFAKNQKKIQEVLAHLNWNYGAGDMREMDFEGRTFTVQRTSCRPETVKFRLRFSRHKVTVFARKHQITVLLDWLLNGKSWDQIS